LCSGGIDDTTGAAMRTASHRVPPATGLGGSGVVFRFAGEDRACPRLL